MKLVSWNVNGLRAAMQKGFKEFFKQADSDIFCIQETKMQEGQIENFEFEMKVRKQICKHYARGGTSSKMKSLE